MSQLKLFTFRHEDRATHYSSRGKGVDGLRDTISGGLKDLKNGPSNEIYEGIDMLYGKFLEDLSEFEESLNGGSVGVVDVLIRVLEEALNSPDSLLRSRIERVAEELKSKPVGSRLSDKDLHNIIAVLP
jgi:hypothetical protein